MAPFLLLLLLPCPPSRWLCGSTMAMCVQVLCSCESTPGANGEGPYFIVITNNNDITNLYLHRFPFKGSNENSVNLSSLTSSSGAGSREDSNLSIQGPERWAGGDNPRAHSQWPSSAATPATHRAQGALPPLLPGSAGQNPAHGPQSLADSSKAGPWGTPSPWGKGQVKGRPGWVRSDAVKVTVPSQPLASPSGQTVRALKGAQPTGAARLSHSQPQSLPLQAPGWQLSQTRPRPVLSLEAQAVPT